MKTRAPAARRAFANVWDEIDYLYEKLLYWLYQRGDPARARRYAGRLEARLTQADPRQEAILGQECRSLIGEARGDLAGAIRHRKNEVHLIRRLRHISRGTAAEADVLRGYGPADLSDRLDLLATLYYAQGDVDAAVDTLRESQRLCQEHGLEFDGADLLDEYLTRKHKSGSESAGSAKALWRPNPNGEKPRKRG